MEFIEIRQNKKTLIPMLMVMTAALLGMTYYIYFSGKFDNNAAMKIIYIFLTAYVLYAICIPVRKFIKNEPVLTLSKSGIEINEKGKPVSLLWQQVVNWRVEKKDDGGTHYLIIDTIDTNRKINISWLDKRPGEIEELLQAFKKI